MNAIPRIQGRSEAAARQLSMTRRLSVLMVSLALAIGFGLAQGDGSAVNLGESAEHGAFLTDAEGFALYLFAPDTQGASTCTDDCAVTWPPFTVEAGLLPAAGEGLDAEMFGTVERADGTFQVTYNGWPLYYYVADVEPGQVNGHLAGGSWHLVNAAGEGIGMAPAGQ